MADLHGFLKLSLKNTLWQVFHCLQSGAKHGVIILLLFPSKASRPHKLGCDKTAHLTRSPV